MKLCTTRSHGPRALRLCPDAAASISRCRNAARLSTRPIPKSCHSQLTRDSKQCYKTLKVCTRDSRSNLREQEVYNSMAGMKTENIGLFILPLRLDHFQTEGLNGEMHQ